MNTAIGVVGVLGWCWVYVSGATQAKSANSAGLTGAVVGVLGLSSRTRGRVFFIGLKQEENTPHASPKKLNKPNTLNTRLMKLLKTLAFKCVGFVSGSSVLCRVRDLREIQG